MCRVRSTPACSRLLLPTTGTGDRRQFTGGVSEWLTESEGPDSEQQRAAMLAPSGARHKDVPSKEHARVLPVAATDDRYGGPKTIYRRGVRVVEGARLESVYTLKAYRGFESLPLRQK
jgi:hypothetical protein